MSILKRISDALAALAQGEGLWQFLKIDVTP